MLAQGKLNVIFSTRTQVPMFDLNKTLLIIKGVGLSFSITLKLNSDDFPFFGT